MVTAQHACAQLRPQGPRGPANPNGSRSYPEPPNIPQRPGLHSQSSPGSTRLGKGLRARGLPPNPPHEPSAGYPQPEVRTSARGQRARPLHRHVGPLGSGTPLPSVFSKALEWLQRSLNSQLGASIPARPLSAWRVRRARGRVSSLSPVYLLQRLAWVHPLLRAQIVVKTFMT